VGASPETELAIKNLIFVRLSPLLVLKVVPHTFFASFWDNHSSEQRASLTNVRDQLITRCVVLVFSPLPFPYFDRNITE
jgi:hypothetical protein